MARFSVIENFDYEDLKLPLGASDSSDTASAPLLASTVFCMQQGDKQTDIQDQELYEDSTLQGKIVHLSIVSKPVTYNLP